MKKTLYFIDGFAPTPEEIKKASKLEAPVEFRNLQLFDPEAPLEKCSAVAGKSPQPYVDKFSAKEEKESK